MFMHLFIDYRKKCLYEIQSPYRRDVIISSYKKQESWLLFPLQKSLKGIPRTKVVDKTRPQNTSHWGSHSSKELYDKQQVCTKRMTHQAYAYISTEAFFQWHSWALARYRLLCGRQQYQFMKYTGVPHISLTKDALLKYLGSVYIPLKGSAN